ncbi:hypothetical protein LINPERHAP1_LOCUS33843 [Linum perenne]
MSSRDINGVDPSGNVKPIPISPPPFSQISEHVNGVDPSKKVSGGPDPIHNPGCCDH